jgi:hypothetical protein
MFKTHQSIAVGVVYAILTVLILVRTFWPPIMGGSFVALFLWLAFAAVTIYDTDCLVLGGCGTWSWIRTVLYILAPIISVTGALVWTLGVQSTAMYGREGFQGGAPVAPQMIKGAHPVSIASGGSVVAPDDSDRVQWFSPQ